MFSLSGPNDEGCDDIDKEMNVTLSNTTIEEETELLTTLSSNETFIVTTVETTVTSEMFTENATDAFEEFNSTVSDIDNNSTASVFIEIIRNEMENSTLIETDEESISTTVSDDTTEVTEISASTTEESIETTTQAEITTITTTTEKSNLCVDSEFECCPDGITPAQVTDFLCSFQNHIDLIIFLLCQGPNFNGCNATEQSVSLTPTTKVSSQSK